MTGMSVHKMLDKLVVKEISGNVEGEVTGLAFHTEKVKKGNLFFALPGSRTKGWEYAGKAVENGALAVVTGEDAPRMDIPCIRTPDVRLAMAILSDVFYNYPSRKMHLTGVTGTNGKTTTTYLINALLEHKGHSTGLIGTVDYKAGDERFSPLSTTPEANELQEFLHYMTKKDISHVVMEVSSHALEWHRVSGCEYDIAVLTNVTEDHLDFHQDFDSYLSAKTKLFSQMGGRFAKMDKPRAAILNRDDPSYAYIAQRTPVQQVSYAVQRKADVYAENTTMDITGSRFTVRTFKGDTEINLKLRGMFNVYNSLAAIAAGLTMGMNLKEIKAGLESVKGIPGRFEQVECGQDYLVIVDYAHTADGLDNVLQTASQLLKNGRIITVFGCGGERDRTKRPLMGQIAGKFSEKCVVTSDNPRGEDPDAIIEDIIPGLEKEMSKEDYHIAVDRYEAIEIAINMAQKGDIVLIAGKGHEDYQVLKDKTISFSDRKVAEELILKK